MVILLTAEAYLFKSILERLRNSDCFNRQDAPVIFIVYAHEDDNSGISEIAKLLDDIHCHIKYDKKPKSKFSKLDQGARSNILQNQICLHSSSENYAGCVILCASPKLKAYMEDENNKTRDIYMEAIKKSCIGSKESKDLAPALEKIFDEYCDEPGFHYVLTELAMLQARDSKNHGIIPLKLEGASKSKEYRHLLKRVGISTHEILARLKDNTDASVHKVFLDLLQRVFHDRFQETIVTIWAGVYEEAMTAVKQYIHKEQPSYNIKAVTDLVRQEGPAEEAIQRNRDAHQPDQPSQTVKTVIDDSIGRGNVSWVQFCDARGRQASQAIVNPPVDQSGTVTIISYPLVAIAKNLCSL